MAKFVFALVLLALFAICFAEEAKPVNHVESAIEALKKVGNDFENALKEHIDPEKLKALGEKFAQNVKEFTERTKADFESNNPVKA